MIAIDTSDIVIDLPAKRIIDIRVISLLLIAPILSSQSFQTLTFQLLL